MGVTSSFCFPANALKSHPVIAVPKIVKPNHRAIYGEITWLLSSGIQLKNPVENKAYPGLVRGENVGSTTRTAKKVPGRSTIPRIEM